MSDALYVEAAIHDYVQVLERKGPAGLEFLNARVPHRFTAIYQLDGSLLRNAYLHDKLGEVISDDLRVVPLKDSFCQFVLRDGYFKTSNSAQDVRLNGLKFQGVLGAYYGVPLLDNRGSLYGTLCHFDRPNAPLEEREFMVLQRVAKILSAYLFRTAPPVRLALNSL